MNNVALVTNGQSKTYTGPSGWDELTAKQFLQYCRMLSQYGTGLEGLFCLLSLWYAIPISRLQQLTDDQRLNLMELLSFLDTRPERWMLPRLRIGRMSLSAYVGPGDGLGDLTFGEFVFAEAALQSYLDTMDLKHAARLAAALYRPYSRKANAYRRPFEARLLDRQTERAERLPDYVLEGIVINYLGCRDRFPSEYKYLFRKSESGEGGGNWVDVGLSLARQTSALGTFNQLEKTELFLALTTLDQILREHKEMEKRMEKHGGSY